MRFRSLSLVGGLVLATPVLADSISSQVSGAMHGAMLGGVAFSALIVLAFAAAARDKVLFIGAGHMVLGFMLGLAALSNASLTELLMLGLATCLSLTVLANRFLDIGPHEPRVRKALAGTACLLAVGLMPLALFKGEAVWPSVGLLIVGLATTATAAFVRAMDGYRPAFWFCLVWLAFALQVATTALTSIGSGLPGQSEVVASFTVTIANAVAVCGALGHRFADVYRRVLTYKSSLETAVRMRTEQLDRMTADLQAANVELERASRQDALTGLHNRRYWDETVPKLIRNAAREEQPVSVLVFDADHFKRVNDTYGHDVGDLCLKQIAQSLGSLITRPLDVVARFGGEEFVALLYGADAHGAAEVATRVQKHLMRHPVATPQQEDISLTLSVGVVCTLGSGLDAESLFKEADNMVYRAKAEGRNRVCVSVPSMSNAWSVTPHDLRIST